MALLNLAQNLLLGCRPAGWVVVQQLGQIPEAQQRNVRCRACLLAEQEQYRQTTQRHVVMPAPPDPHLVLRHAQLAFGLMECVLRPEFDLVAL